MALLIDTCTLIWFGSGSPKIPDRVRLRLAQEVVWVSEISRIEIVIKEAKFGAFGIDFDALIKRAGFVETPFPVGAHRHLAALPDYHRDPFDRMLIAQALHEGSALVTSDADVLKYDVPTFW